MNTYLIRVLRHETTLVAHADSVDAARAFAVAHLADEYAGTEYTLVVTDISPNPAASAGCEPLVGLEVMSGVYFFGNEGREVAA